MRSRRVPVFKLGSRVQEATKSRCVYVRQAFASVRKSSQAFTSVGECRASSGIANRRETQNCRHFLRFALQKCQQSQGSGGSSSRNAELSSLLESSRVFASQKCQQSQGSGGVLVAKRRTVVTFGLVLRLRVSKLSTVTGIGGGSSSRNAELSSLLDLSCVFASQNCQQSQGSGGVLVAKRRTVVTFGLVLRLRVSKLSTVTGIGGSSSRNAELSSLLESSPVFVSQKCQHSQGSGGVLVAKCRTVVTFGFVSNHRVSKVSTVTGIGGVLVAKRRTVVSFGLVSGRRVSKVSTVTGIGGVLVAKRRTVVTFGVVLRLRVSKVSTVTGIGGGPRRETQNCRHFWTCLASSRLKSVNSHRDRGGSSSRNAELSSLLESSPVFVSQKCQQSQGSGGSSSRNAELSSLLALPLERGEEREERRQDRRERRGKKREEGGEKR